MPTMHKSQRTLAKILKPYGLEMRMVKTGHVGIFRSSDGQRIYTTAGTPSDCYSMENCMRSLSKLGFIPERFRQKRLR